MEKSGYCKDRIFRSLRPPLMLPKDQNLHIVSFLFRNSSSYLQNLALADAETAETLDFLEFQNQVNLIGRGLFHLGIRKNDVVLLFSPNSIYFPVCFFGILSIGGIVTTANPVYTTAELEKQVKDSKPKMVITVSKLVVKVESLGLPIIQIGDNENKANHDTSVVGFRDLLRLGEGRDVPHICIKQSDTAALLYSSGTTGINKGVILTHRNFMASALMLTSDHDLRGEGPSTVLILIPMFHVYGLTLTFAQLQRGSAIATLGKFNFVKMLDAIEKYRVSHLPIVPPIMTALAKEEIVKRYDLSSLRQIASGAAPLGKEVQETCASKLPHTSVLQGYGLTESCGIATVDFPTGRARVGSAGLLVQGLEGKIINIETGKSLPPNQSGEICLRGPNIMKGYLNNRQATKNALDAEGWLHTGDMGFFDENGYLFIVDRIKELIKYKGLQVAPAELEALLISHPQILDAAVIPQPDAAAGEVPVGYVVRVSGSSPTEDEIMEYVAQQVAPYKRLHRITFVNAIPKSASGKILRRELSTLAKSKL
eukprot:TRINITY_DN28852_c0_g1_i1.p1 TRINITY_DN28852_c0_g1~~TRINITY_DN28852_c0_g1_i1.p1  ORF type:complete len:539 (-),score=88.27 TRINITY_DN28852_c0_g1_i1:453-2069(-)